MFPVTAKETGKFNDTMFYSEKYWLRDARETRKREENRKAHFRVLA